MTDPGQVEEKIRIKKQPGNENGNDNDTTQPSRSSLCKRIRLSVAAEEFQRPPGVRIQQKNHCKQHGLNDLSGCIMTREEMRLVAILA